MELSKNKLASCLNQKFTLPVISAHLSDKMVSLTMPNNYFYKGYKRLHVCYQSFSFISALINIEKYIRNICKKETTQPLIPIFEIAIIISCWLGWVTWLTLLQ